MLLFTLLSLQIAGLPVGAQVSYERLLHAAEEPQNWLTYNGSYNSIHHSALDSITPENVKQLEVDWVFQARSLEKFEAAPLVVDGVMYVTEAPNNVFALDARTGRVFGSTSMTCPKRSCPAAAASTAAWRFSTTRFSWPRSTCA